MPLRMTARDKGMPATVRKRQSALRTRGSAVALFGQIKYRAQPEIPPFDLKSKALRARVRKKPARQISFSRCAPQSPKCSAVVSPGALDYYVGGRLKLIEFRVAVNNR